MLVIFCLSSLLLHSHRIPPGVHIENQPTGLRFPTVRARQLCVSIVSGFMPGSSSRRWENSGATGTRMATLAREFSLCHYCATATVPRQCVIAGVSQEVPSRGKLCRRQHSRPPSASTQSGMIEAILSNLARQLALLHSYVTQQLVPGRFFSGPTFQNIVRSKPVPPFAATAVTLVGNTSSSHSLVESEIE